MTNKPILFCSTKAVQHMALIAHLYDVPYKSTSINKIYLNDRSWYSATFFTEKVSITQPIIGHLNPEESLAYKNYILENARSPFNQINYSELIIDEHFKELSDHFTIVQLLVEPQYRRGLILRRIFHLYGKRHRDYVFLDQGLGAHRGSSKDQTRLTTFMVATGWKEPSDLLGFMRYLLSPNSPIFTSFLHEDSVKRKRGGITVSYGSLFDGTGDYGRICDLVGKTQDRSAWQDLLASTVLPKLVYKFGRYWNIDEI